jgi:hypothetical protein
LVWLRFSLFRFEPTCKVSRIFGLRLHQPSDRKFDPPLPTRAELTSRPGERPRADRMVWLLPVLADSVAKLFLHRPTQIFRAVRAAIE